MGLKLASWLAKTLVPHIAKPVRYVNVVLTVSVQVVTLNVSMTID